MAYKIVIDPGHGGSDWGASFNGRKEKDDVRVFDTCILEIS